ncbi:uncharacterized protein LOC143052606 [Mytilus galloprovincialis]|uniref:uncharacterized protein LOC143052606 n=1 Tax=Mytilus galloprovincialis TaxID=29158 RepID=UPI003F7BEA6B
MICVIKLVTIEGVYVFFCKNSNCEKALCATCVIMEHKNHPVEDIESMIADRKQKFQQLLQSVRNKQTTVKDLENRSKKSIQFLNDQAKAYRKQVNDSYDKGVQKLREKREKVIDCLEKVHDRNEKRLNTTNEKLTLFLMNANECCKISEELLENSSKISFLTLERTVREHLRNFLVSEIDQLDVQGNSLSNEIDEISNKFEAIINHLDKVDGTKQAAIMEVARVLLYASISSIQKIGRFLYQCLKLIIITLIILVMVVPFLARTTPMHEVDPGYVPGLHFDIEGNNPYMFPCNTADNRTVSTRMSESGMICRQSQHSNRRIYGEKGFSRRKEYHLDIILLIETKINKKKKEKNIHFGRRDVNDVIFEFGITTKKDDSSLYLYERKHNSWVITGYACENDVGICLRTNEKQLFPEKSIFKSRRNKSFTEASFTVNIELHKRRCEILSNDVPLHTFENVSNEFVVWPVYGIYDDKKYISITITSTGQLFDKSTLFPNVPLFISGENTVFANRNSTPGTKTVLFNEFQRFVSIKPLDNFHRYENIIHILDIAIPEFINLPNNTVLLEIGFMIETPNKDTVIIDRKILITNSFTYYTSVFGLKKSVAYCIEDSLNKLKVCSLAGWFSGLRKLSLILNFDTLSSSIIFSLFNEMPLTFMILSKEPWVTMPRLLIRKKCQLSEPGIIIAIRAPSVLDHLVHSKKKL